VTELRTISLKFVQTKNIRELYNHSFNSKIVKRKKVEVSNDKGASLASTQFTLCNKNSNPN